MPEKCTLSSEDGAAKPEVAERVIGASGYQQDVEKDGAGQHRIKLI